MPIAEDSRSLKFNFGVTEAAYRNGNATDGVEFAILDLRLEPENQEIFRRLLDPMNVVSDQGLQNMEIDLTASGEGELILLTRPGPNGNTSWDWSYWGNVTIE